MLEILQYPFMQRSLIASLLIGFIASYLSTFVVQRKMSFLGSGLAHASFGGVALGLLLGIEPLWIAAPFTIVVGLLITWIRQNTKLEMDTAVGILFSVSMALGIVFLSFRNTYSADAMTYLFGSILAIQNTDLWFAFALLIVVLTFSFKWKAWAYATFDMELALADRRRVHADDYLLTFLISLSIVVSLKILGIVLLAAFFVIPAAAARLVSQTFSEMMWKSTIIGVSSSFLGIFFSYHLDVPSGASIILTQAAIFGAAILVRRFR